MNRKDRQAAGVIAYCLNFESLPPSVEQTIMYHRVKQRTQRQYSISDLDLANPSHVRNTSSQCDKYMRQIISKSYENGKKSDFFIFMRVNFVEQIKTKT